jgi:hypothetical protein
LKAIARTPDIPKLTTPPADGGYKQALRRPGYVWQARTRNLRGLGDRSAYGLPGEYGVLLVDVPPDSFAARAGLQRDDVVLACNGKPTRTAGDIWTVQNEAAGGKLALEVRRKQQTIAAEVADYAFVVTECQGTPEFKAIPLAPASAVLPAKAAAGDPGTRDNPLSALTDGQLARNYGPVFGNGVTDGVYKLDLGAAKSVAQVNTYSFNQGGGRGRQCFALYGSSAPADPGWNVEDARVFTPIAAVDTPLPPKADFMATSIRRSDGKPLGSYRWLAWAVSPATPAAGGENTAFQELQVIPAAGAR